MSTPLPRLLQALIRPVPHRLQPQGSFRSSQFSLGHRANYSLDRSSPSSSSLPPTQKSGSSAHLHVVLPSAPKLKDVSLTLTSSNNTPSSTLLSKGFTTDIPLPTTTALSGGSPWPTKCQLDAKELGLPEEGNLSSATKTLGHLPLPAPTRSLFPQDENTRAHKGIPNASCPQPSLPLVEPTLGISGLSSYSSPSLSPSLSLTSTSAPHFTLTDNGKGPGNEPVGTTTRLSDSLPSVYSHGGKTPRTTSVTTSVLSTTSVVSSSVLKPTDSVVVTNHAPSAMHSSPVPSDTLQGNGKSKPEPSRSGSRVSLSLDSPLSSPTEVGRIAVSTASSSSLSTTSFITSTTIAAPTPSLTSVDGVRLAPLSNPNQLAVVDVLSTTNLTTPTALSQAVTTSFTTTTAVVTFSPIQISGTSTSIPVTQTVQTVLPTVLPVSPVTDKKSAPIAAIVAPVSAVVILILLFIGFLFRRSRQRANRASSLPAFDFSTPAPAMRKTEPVQQPLSKEVTVLPPTPSMGGWSDLARAFPPAEPKPAQDLDDPFADPNPTIEKKPPDESPRTHRATVPSLVPLPAPTLGPFSDPPALVSMFPDDDGPSRLSKGSMHNESMARASVSSIHVSSHLRLLSSTTI
ncbi:hypothetical protein BJY52DRAFT_1265177 [Lactarius psammicola]|nr:hypothetical protein BJY52DRAFT_1265177 [Lactarius psammicola]